MKRRLFLEWFALLCCACLLAGVAAYVQFTQRLDGLFLDHAANLARSEPSDDIVIAAIDDASLEQLGPWPWSRQTHAELIDNLDAAGARLILYDVLFMERTEEEADQRLASAIEDAGNVILPLTFAAAPNQSSGIVEDLPLAEFSEAAQSLGHVVATVDDDGILRRFELEREANGTIYPHFIKSALLALGDTAAASSQDGRPPLPGRPIISAHPIGTYPTLSASSLIAGEVPPELIRNRIVLVGATAQGMGDRYPIASGYAVLMPGVETQANLLDALRIGSYVREAHWAWSIALAVLALILQFIVFWRLPARPAFLATLAIAVACLVLPLLLVFFARIWLAPGAALLLVLFAYPFWSWRRLTAVSSYLEEEAAGLERWTQQPRSGEGFDLIARQVSRMKALVGHVNRSFEFLQTVIEAAPDSIVVFDEDGKIAMANHQLAENFPGFPDSEEARFNDLVRQSDAKFDSERGELTLPNGQIFLVARQRFEMQGRHGSWDIVALRDVTELRELDQEWREMLEFLSHDMRTPQVAIIGLADRAGDSDSSVGRRIREQAAKTLKLADDFVQLARLKATSLELEEADLASLIEEACDTAYSQAKQKNISITSDIAGEDGFALVDASMIARMLDNLIGNAIKYSPEGSSVRIGLSEAQGNQLVIEISDSGPGLPPERAGAPFERFGHATKSTATSSGLGLAFVKRAVDRHGGTITVGNTSGGFGTRFRISLPRSPG